MNTERWSLGLSNAGMSHSFDRNSPIRADSVFDINFNPIDRQVENLALLHTEVIPKQDLDFGPYVGLFCLFDLYKCEPVRPGRIDDFIDGAPKQLRDVHPELLKATSVTQDRSLKLLDEHVVLV